MPETLTAVAERIGRHRAPDGTPGTVLDLAARLDREHAARAAETLGHEEEDAA